MQCLSRVALLFGFVAVGFGGSPGIAAAENELQASSLVAEVTPTRTAERLQKDVETLASPAYRGRAWPDSLRAGEFVADRFASLGLRPLFGESFRQVIPAGRAKLEGANIGAVLPGTDPARAAEFVIVSAHHDHLGSRGTAIWPGADDNASGVAAVLELARRLAANPPARPVVFVTFDLEERLLWGSQYFVANPPFPLEDIRLFLTADMLGRRLGDLPIDEVFVMGTESAVPLRGLVQEAAEHAGQPVALLATEIVGTRSDYGPFRRHEVPFLFFSTGEHRDYHRTSDTPEKLDYPRAARIVDLLEAIVRRSACSDEDLTWDPQSPDGVAEAAVLYRLATLLEERHAAGTRRLTTVELLLVRRMQTEAAAVVEAGRITPRQRTWLVNGARAMLLLVF